MSVPAHQTLLVVDDDLSILALVSEVARRMGMLVLTADSGASFRHALLQVKPGMILLDLQIPDTDGVENLRYLATQGCTAEIVLMSGLDPKVLSSARQFGLSLGLRMSEVVRKPVRVQDIEAVLSRCILAESVLQGVELRNAISEYELTAFYQPILHRTRDGWVLGSVEALVRWRHPRHGLLLPEQFLPLAERENLMGELTDFVLAESLRQLGHWHRRGWRLSLSVNLPASCIADVHFPDRLVQVLREHGVPPTYLCFDVTESAMAGDRAVLMESFARLRMRGVDLAMDDFGIGTSSLTQLYQLPYSAMKMDRGLIAEAMTSQQARTVVSALVDLGHKLSLQVCAEGVQTQAGFDMLEQFGCDLMQGELISPPRSAADMEAFLSQWDSENHQDSALLAG